MSRTINFYVKTTLGALVDSALVRVLTTAGVFVTEATSNGSGKAGPLVIADGTYEVVVSKQGFVFSTPYTLVVTADEDFDLTGTAPTTPTATDANRCRVYGVLRSPNGQPLPNASIILEPADYYIIAGGDSVVGSVRIASDKNGVVDFELYRNISYFVRMPSMQSSYSWEGSSTDATGGEHFSSKSRPVPDQSAVSLSSFLVPYPTRVQFSTPAITVASSNVDSSVTISVLETNGVVAGDARTSAIEYTSSDTAIALMSVGANGALTVTGVTPGTVTMTASYSDDYPPRVVPSPTLVVDTFTVTVT